MSLVAIKSGIRISIEAWITGVIKFGDRKPYKGQRTNSRGYDPPSALPVFIVVVVVVVVFVVDGGVFVSKHQGFHRP